MIKSLKRRFRTLPIRQVVGIGFLLVLLIALITAALGRAAYDISRWQREAVQTRSDVATLTLELKLLATQRTETLDRYLETSRVNFLAEYQIHQSSYADTSSRLRDLLRTEAEQNALAAVRTAEIEFNSKAEEVLRLYNDQFPAAARFLWNSEGLAAQDDLIQAIDTLSRVQGRASEQILERNAEFESIVVISISVFISLALLGGFVASWFITQRITRPISSLVSVVSRISDDLTTRADPYGPEEIEFLGHTINEMAENLLISEQELQRRKEQMEQELRIASQIQASFFPQTLPRIRGLEVAVFWQPAREMGGDFYAFVNVSPGQKGIAIGDASGKGAPAAMASALAFGYLDAYAPTHHQPEALIANMNRELFQRLKANNMNVAGCYAILDEQTRHLRVANAGCVYPYLRRATGTLEAIEVGGLPMGMVPDFGYEARAYQLYTDDLILFSSDGLVEAQNEHGEMFGFDRLEAELSGLPPRVEAQTALNHLVTTAKAFTNGRDMGDDLTVIAIRVVE